MNCDVPRAALPRGAWDRFVLAHPEGWFFHSEAWLDYALAYAPGSRDASVAIVSGDEVEAVVPAVLATDGSPTYGGQPMAAPLLGDNIDMEWEMFPSMRVAWRPGTDIDDITVPSTGTLQRDTTFVVDLWDGDEVAHWRRLRKSYRSLVHQAERDYDIVVASGISQNTQRLVYAVAQDLHVEAAGRRTRSAATWELMTQWASAGQGLVAVAQDRATQAYVGFAYAIRWKHWSYWMSGATLRRNLQHALQWHLMKALMCDGETRYYEIGHAADHAAPDDEKAKNIAFFKAGFGGQRWTVLSVDGSHQ